MGFVENVNTIAVDLGLGTSSSVGIVADNIADINTVSNNIADVTTVSNNIADVQVTSTDITNINIVANAIAAGAPIPSASGQFLGSSVIGSVLYTAQNTAENLTLLAGTNGLIVDSITIEDGGSITVEDTAVLKVV